MARNKQDKPKNIGGRPPSLIADDATIDKVKMIAGLQCTQPEAAAILEVSLACFEGFLRANKKAREAWDDGRENGRASVRRMQFNSAKAGNVTMQIWLGKQYLGQKDKQETELTGKDGGPIEVKNSTDELVSRIARLASRAGENGGTRRDH